ncbi:MAG: Stp1/IreP family PP2C-type Ser/Thr phosphatase [Chloroflexi bacterium]|nr:Stp1/IreP family PP2C-type Ser/Thr phosphatase [Chloroflexota bacterium]
MSTTGVRAPGRQIAVGARGDTGRVRTNNEDRYCALLPPNTLPGVGGVLAVADGVGGHQAGEVASQMAVDGVAAFLGRASNLAEAQDGDRLPLLRSVVTRINRQVFDAASRNQSGAGMGTTLSVAMIEGSSVWIGHVGDSRVYLYRDKILSRLTPDHSWVAEEVARGAMTPQEAETHPRRNILTRAVGTAQEVEPATIRADLLPGDSLLLCSDGLYGMVTEDRIAAVLGAKPPDEAADVLVDMANTAGGTDNVTVIVAQVLSTEPLPPELWEGGLDVETIVPRSATKRSSRRFMRIVLFPILAPFKALLWLARNLRLERR